MKMTILLKTALRALYSHKGRSILTMLSIIVGISAIVATLAIGKGAEEKIRRKIMAMGKNYIFVHGGNRFSDQGATGVKRKRRARPLLVTDVKIIEKQAPHVLATSPAVFRTEVVRFGTRTLKTSVEGVTEKAFIIGGKQLASGASFTSEHIARNARVAVLGAKAAEELFGKQDPLGKMIRVNKQSFKIIGVLVHEDLFLGTHDPNLHVYFPFMTMKKYILHDVSARLDGIILSAEHMEDMPVLVSSIKKILRYRHKLKGNEPDDFTIYDQKSMAAAAHESSAVLNIFLFIIASISLLVGGIGVMNIMLVSVTERTNEIGLRMALGATAAMIRRQFLLESLTLCSIGGFIGLALGILLPYVASFFTGWLVIIQPLVMIGALIITCSIGLFFGLYPACKAAQLRPVEALIE